MAAEGNDSRRAFNYEKMIQAVYLRDDVKVLLPTLSKTSAVVESLHLSFNLGAVYPITASS